MTTEVHQEMCIGSRQSIEPHLTPPLCLKQLGFLAERFLPRSAT